jgi:hypothetical protein
MSNEELLKENERLRGELADARKTNRCLARGMDTLLDLNKPSPKPVPSSNPCVVVVRKPIPCGFDQPLPSVMSMLNPFSWG